MEKNHRPFDGPTLSVYQTRRSAWSPSWKYTVLVVLAFLAARRSLVDFIASTSRTRLARISTCPTPLPPLSYYGPVSLSQPLLQQASHELTKSLRSLMVSGELDSMNVGIVLPQGTIYEFSAGARLANASSPYEQGTVDRDTMYRIASVSKLFTVVETLILQEKGILHLDDPVTRFFPNFTYIPYGCTSSENCPTSVEPITLRQLATHLSGLARDLPAGTAPDWPHKRVGDGPPPMNDLPFPTHEQALHALAQTPQISPPWTAPIYSNTGWSLLGACNVRADQLAGKSKEGPNTHWELLERDVFGPLGMNGSGFLVTEQNRHRVAAGSAAPDEVDLDFLDWSNPSGGQISSLHDLTLLLHALLDPPTSGGLLSRRTLREWMRPVHGFGDGQTETGLVWEIGRVEDMWGIRQRIFHKFGNLASSHAAFALNPESGYGMAVLTTSPSSKTERILQLAQEAYQPAFDKIRAHAAETAFSGTWSVPPSLDGSRKASEAEVVFRHGQLWIDKLVLDGSDSLALLTGSKGESARLWWISGGDFRISYSPAGFSACMGEFALVDEVARKDGWPINLVRFEGDEDDSVLNVPAAGIELRRGK